MTTSAPSPDAGSDGRGPAPSAATTQRWTHGIDRAVGEIADRLDDLVASGLGAGVVVRSKIRVVVAATGASKRTRALLDALGAALDRAGLFYDPELVELSTDRNRIVRFSRKPLDPVHVDKELFASEYGLEEYLEHNLHRIAGLDGLVPYKRQFELPNGDLIDLLCRDTATGGFAVVELKRGVPDRGVVTQTIDYTRRLADSDFADGRPVRAVIVTGVEDNDLIRDALVLATRYRIDLRWYIYDVGLTVANVAATGVPPRRPEVAPTPAPRSDPERRPVGHYDDRALGPRGWQG